MYHIKKSGTNNKLLILFHGTGGDAKEMIVFGNKLDPNANLIAIEGDIKQWRMNRYFIRYEDGGLDLNNLKSQTEKVYSLMLELIEQYKFQDITISLVGYSNGANLILNFLKTYEPFYKNAVILHPGVLREDVEFIPHEALNVLVTSGVNDQYLSMSQFDELIKALKTADYNVKATVHQYGHELIDEEVQKVIKFISK